MGRMRVAFISAECEPWAKTGGLADVVDALARAVGRLGDGLEPPVDVYLPRYRGVSVPSEALVASVAPGRHGLRLRVPDPLAPEGSVEVSIVDVAANGYRLRLVDHPPAYDRDGIYGDYRDGNADFPDNAWRFGLLCRAALEAIRAEGAGIDVLHLHDWHAAPAVIFRDLLYADDPIVGRAACLLTVHNLAFHGWLPRERLVQLGLRPGGGAVAADADGLDLLRMGIERSELVNTVSEGFAAEALTPAYGMGLDEVLRVKGDRFFGILNGIDTGLWDPATDPDIAAPYSVADRSGKSCCRADLLRDVGFDPDDPGPVFGMIGRLDPQKGFDLLAGASDGLLARGVRLVLEGSGDAALAEGVRGLAASYPNRVALIERFDRVLARKIYAGADLFVMPSRFEPSGQGQMIAMRYGTPPIVRRTGGLADTVLDVDERPLEGTGFVFDEPTPVALLDACVRAMAAFRDNDQSRWEGLVGRAMAMDFDWVTGSSARRYVAAYRRAMELRRR